MAPQHKESGGGGGNESQKMVLNRALMNAAYFGNTKEAIRLLDRGVDANYHDPRDGWQPLHYAARWGKVRMAEALLNHGADVNCRTFEKETPLHVACGTQKDRTRIATLLMMRGANPNMLSAAGSRPAEMADAETEEGQAMIMVCDRFEEYRRVLTQSADRKSASASPRRARSSSPRGASRYGKQ